MNNFSQFHNLRIKTIILLVFLISVGLLLWKKYQEVYEYPLPNMTGNWNFSEWMINYTGGFVRRGLAGQILLKAHQLFEIDFVATVIIFNIIIYLCILTYFSFRAWKLSHKLWPFLFLILNPSLILFPILDGSPFRKDLIPILITVIHVILIERVINQRKNVKLKSSFYSPIAFFLIGILTTILSLLHETISLTAFMPLNIFLSISYLVTVENILGQQLVRKVTAIYFTGALAGIISVIMKGDNYVAETICMSWQGIIPMINCNESIPLAIEALRWSFGQALMYSAHLINSGTFLLYILILILMMIFTIPAMANLYQQEESEKELTVVDNNIQWQQALPILTLLDSSVDQRKEFILHLYLFLLIFSIPLYILGWDWGRYFFIIAMQVGIIVLSPITFSILLNFYKKYLINYQIFKITHLKTSQTKLFHIKNFLIKTYSSLFKRIIQFSSLSENNLTITLFLLLICGLPHAGIKITQVFNTSFAVQLFKVVRTLLGIS